MSDLILPPRYDGIANAASGALTNRYTGMNTTRDKSTRWETGFFYPLPEQQRGILHAESFECQRVCEVLPEEMTRAGWEIAIDDGDNDVVSKALDYDKRLGLKDAFEQAEFHRRLDDGAIVILLIDDGQTPDQPVNESRVRSLLPIPKKNILSRWQVSTSDISSDPEFYKVWYQANILDPKGESVQYQYKDWSGWIHRSRVLRFDDGSCSRLIRQQNQGWSPGALLRFVNVFQSYFSGFQALNAMLQDASIFTYAIKGLGEILLGGGEKVLRDRLAENWLATSVYGAVIHDAENEKVGFTERNLSGWDSSLDRLERRLVAASEIPHSYLLGRAGPSGGLTGNGDDEAKLMAQIANRKQEKCFRKHLEYCYRLIFAAKDGPVNGKKAPNYTVNFRPLALPSPMEQAELEATVIQKDVQAISAGIYTAEDALRSHYSTPNFNPSVTIDWEAKEQELEAAKQQAEDQQFADEEPAPDEEQNPEDFNLEEFQGDSDDDESVSWEYGTGTATGKVVKQYDRPITLTIKKKSIKRNGSQDDPALLIEQEDGSRVLKLRSEVRSDAVPDKYSHVNFTPPLKVQKAFKRGLELHKQGFSGKGLERATVEEARAIASGQAVTPAKVDKAVKWFARNARFSQASEKTPAGASWWLWGGSAARGWFKSLKSQMIAADASAAREDAFNPKQLRDENGRWAKGVNGIIPQRMKADVKLKQAHAGILNSVKSHVSKQLSEMDALDPDWVKKIDAIRELEDPDHVRDVLLDKKYPIDKIKDEGQRSLAKTLRAKFANTFNESSEFGKEDLHEFLDKHLYDAIDKDVNQFFAKKEKELSPKFAEAQQKLEAHLGELLSAQKDAFAQDPTNEKKENQIDRLVNFANKLVEVAHQDEDNRSKWIDLKRIENKTKLLPNGLTEDAKLLILHGTPATRSDFLKGLEDRSRKISDEVFRLSQVPATLKFKEQFGDIFKGKTDSEHLDKKCGGGHIAENLKCHAGVAAEHLGENLASWSIGKTVGGAIAQLATAHGLDPGVARVMSEAGVQALAATAIHARKKENRNASELTTKFLSELAGASAGKVLHYAVETNDDGLLGDDYVKALVATISGKAGGIVTTTSAAKALKKQGELLKGVVQRIGNSRTDADSRDDIQLSNAERSALFDLSLAGYLIGLNQDRQDSTRPSCADCLIKHLSSAAILMDEALHGYPEHKFLAIGHLAQSEEEALDQYPEVAAKIREIRKAYANDDVVPDYRDLYTLVQSVRTDAEGKVAKVMREFKQGKLKSSSGKKVKNRKQAIAIALSEAERQDDNSPIQKVIKTSGGELKEYRVDATQCGRGWQGTKPGCTRTKKKGGKPTSKKTKLEAYTEHPIIATFTEKPPLLEGESIGDRRKRWESAKAKEIDALVKRGKSQKLDFSHPEDPEGWRNIQASNKDREQFIAALAASSQSRRDWMTGELHDAKKLATEHKVTPEDALAIKLYTSNDFASMNGALRGLTGNDYLANVNANMATGRTIDAIKNEALQGARVVAAALNKLPDYVGDVYRGFSLRDDLTLDDIQAMYKPGGRVVEKGFTSTTRTAPEEGNAFGSKPVQFVIKSKSGKSVRDFSESKSEEEVLFRPYTPFKVMKVLRDGDRLTIHMEED